MQDIVKHFVKEDYNMKLKEIIELLKELNEEDYYIKIENDPIIEEFVRFNGDGIATFKKHFYIEFTGKETQYEKFESTCGIKKFKNQKKIKKEVE